MNQKLRPNRWDDDHPTPSPRALIARLHGFRLSKVISPCRRTQEDVEVDQNEEDEAEDGHVYRVNENLGRAIPDRLIDEHPDVHHLFYAEEL